MENKDNNKKLLKEWIQSLILQSMKTTDNEVMAVLFNPDNNTYTQTTSQVDMNLDRRLVALKEQLDKSVFKEDYEMAVIFRDKIQHLESVKPTYKELLMEKKEAVSKMEFERAMEIEKLKENLLNPKDTDTKK